MPQRLERIQSSKGSCGSQKRWKGQICFEYAVERRSQGSQRRDECFRITLLSIFVFKLSLTMPLCSWLPELRGYTASKTLQERTWHIAAGTLHPNYVNQDCKWQPVSTWLPLYDPRKGLQHNLRQPEADMRTGLTAGRVKQTAGGEDSQSDKHWEIARVH